MIFTTLILASASALVQTTVPPGPPAAATARTVQALPNTTIAYFDVPGRNGEAVEKALKKMMADPALRATVQPYGWNVAAQVSKRTEGDKCTVIGVKSTLTNTVNLPRLADAKKADAGLTRDWAKYVASVESDAAASLWFVADRLPALERSMAGIPCDRIATTWNGGIEKIKQEQLEFARQRSVASPAAASSGTPDGTPPVDKDY